MSFALFVSRNKKRPSELCPGSTLCSDFLQNIDEREVEVVDCNRADFNRPLWLKGTPTLYEYETKKTWTGHKAVQRLYHLSLHYAMTPPATTNNVAPPRVQQQQRPAGETTASTANDSVDKSIWESQITPDMENTEEEEETRSDRKMTSDDLQRAMSQRIMSNSGPNANGDPPPTMNAPPPPPPALKD